MRSISELVTVTLPRGRAKIVVVADVHLGAIEHNHAAWVDFIERVKADPDIYVILAGDLINNGIAGSVANPFEEVMTPAEQKRAMVDYLMPIKDRILCAVSGNHEGRTIKAADQDVTYDIMAKLDLEDRYRRELAVLHVRMERRNRVCASWYIAVTHGAGSGYLTGSSVNRVERFAANFEGLDAVVMGHTHKPSITPRAVMYIDSKSRTLRKKEQWCIVTCSWLQYGGYAAAKVMAPTSDSKPQVLVIEHKIRSGGNDVKLTGVEWL